MSYAKKLANRIFFSQRAFAFFQSHGIHLMPKHFYSPIPDTMALARNEVLWTTESALVGVDLNTPEALDMLDNVFTTFRNELAFPLSKTSNPSEYYVGNGAFGYISAITLHCMIRHFLPKTIIEVGSGNSTYISARASLMNAHNGQATKLLSIEPFPNQTLCKGFPGLTEHIASKVEHRRRVFCAARCGRHSVHLFKSRSARWE